MLIVIDAAIWNMKPHGKSNGFGFLQGLHVELVFPGYSNAG